MTQNTIATASDIIDALGGTGAVAALRGLGAPAVSMWRRIGIPGAHRLPLLRIAEQRGLTFPDAAFETIEPPPPPDEPAAARGTPAGSGGAPAAVVVDGGGAADPGTGSAAA